MSDPGRRVASTKRGHYQTAVGADSDDSTLDQTYGYDLLDRLTAVTKNNGNQAFTYDAVGNRKTYADAANSSTYAYAATSNRLASITGAQARTVSYDNAGNTTAYLNTTFGYDDAGRMVSSISNGAGTLYEHNAHGQRVRKVASGVSTYFVYDEAGHLIGEYNGAGTLIQETIWLDDIPAATIRPNGTGGVNIFYVHTDHLSTPRVITDASNQIRWRWDRDPFGTTSANQNPSGLGVFTYNLRLPGQYYDSETGLHYNYFRDYDPATGRYVESDPIGLEGGLNTYTYVDGAPTKYVDPDGRIMTDPRTLECARLRLLVWMSCKLKAERCRGTDSCDVLRAKHDLALKCAEYQSLLTSRCYADRPSHRKVISDAFNRARNCDRLAARNRCGGCAAP